MRELVKDLKLLKGDLVNLIDNIYAGYVNTTSFNDVDEVIGSGIIAQRDVSIMYSVLTADGLHRL